MKYRHYTGIGSRKTPQNVCDLMTVIAKHLAERDFILRSGGANGADLAFEAGAGEAKAIWIPWRGFNGSDGWLLPSLEAFRLAAEYHPAWDLCTDAARKLHARNMHQVLGPDLMTPSEFVICWTKGAELVGGTAQALRVALDYKIPIYNLADEDQREALRQFLNGL